MRQDLTDISILLDSSGSMQPLVHDTIGGFNSFLEEQKKLPGSAVFSLVSFNIEYRQICKAIPIRDASPLTDRDYVPGNNTALLDALGRLIDETGERLKNMPENERPGKVIFVIITDGQENSSHKFARKDIFERINRQRDVYKWDFVFMGANQDSFAEAGQIGVSSVNAINYTGDSRGTKNAYRVLCQGMGSYRVGGQSVGGFFGGMSHADMIEEQKKAEQEKLAEQQKSAK